MIKKTTKQIENKKQDNADEMMQVNLIIEKLVMLTFKRTWIQKLFFPPI